MFRFIVFKFFHFIVNVFPSHWSYVLAKWGSFLCYKVNKSEREGIRRNLNNIFSFNKQKKIASDKDVQEVFHQFGIYLVEFFQLKKLTQPKFIAQNFQFEGVDQFEKIWKSGRKVIALTVHIGNWELGASLLGSLGYPVTVIALPHKERLVTEFFNKQRAIRNVEVVYVENAAKGCLQTLKNNRVLAIAGDRDFTLNGDETSFFGKKTVFPKGPALFALRSEAVIIPSFLIRKGREKFVLKMGDPIDPRKFKHQGHSIEKSVHLLREEYIKTFEKVIAEYPTQWVVLKDFWIL